MGNNPIREQLEKAQALDRRRQLQVQNQIAAINRLAACLEGGKDWAYDDEMQALHEKLAEVQYQVEVLTAELAEEKKAGER